MSDDCFPVTSPAAGWSWFVRAWAGTPQGVTAPVPRQRTERPAHPPPWWRTPWWRRLGSLGDARTGAAPAASALGLRRALAVFGLVFCGVFSGLLAVAGRTVPAVVLGIIAATALVDLVVIHRRAGAARRADGPRP